DLEKNVPARDGAGRYKTRSYSGKAKDKKSNGNADADDALYFEADESASPAERRKAVRRLYQKLDQTQEWAENNYYHLLNEQQNAVLITANKFWSDLAEQDPAKPFRTVNVAEASHNFTESMFALSLVDLPFEPAKQETKFEGAKMTITAGS